MTSKTVKLMHCIALILSLIWACWWTFFGLVSGAGEGFRGVIMNAPNALPGFIFLISVFIAWKWGTVGGIILVLEGLIVIVGYPLLVRGRASLSVIILILLMLALPPLIAGFLFLASSRKSSMSTVTVRKRCSRDDYMNLSNEEKRQLISEFLSFIKTKFPVSEFGYDSFHGLKYDQMVLSTIFSTLKEAGHIQSAGYMKFRLIK